MILDIHTHNFKGQADAVAAAAFAHGIDRFLFLGDVLRYGDQPTQEQIRQLNNKTAADVRRYFDYRRGLCFLNPDNATEFVAEEANRCLDMPEFLGIKMEICTNCRSARMEPINITEALLAAPKGHVLFGSHAPFFVASAALSKLQDGMPEEDAQAIARDNALAILRA
ncbi:MAG TPA: hypothetical protein PLE92_10445 [Lentisphaeria bacterium]|nr:hypothetical protein [Lentisphaerota bacterium]HPY90971.1 hypothetical protein [Lentisphaeria bacterium]HQC53543.1 hypothetical protein [Lentisphaeria bacterium]